VPADFLDPSLGEAQDLAYDGWDLYSHDPRGAKESFEEALELDPDLADAYNGLAGLAADKKRFEEAEALYRTAYEKARAELGTKLMGEKIGFLHVLALRWTATADSILEKVKRLCQHICETEH